MEVEVEVEAEVGVGLWSLNESGLKRFSGFRSGWVYILWHGMLHYTAGLERKGPLAQWEVLGLVG